MKKDKYREIISPGDVPVFGSFDFLWISAQFFLVQLRNAAFGADDEKLMSKFVKSSKKSKNPCLYDVVYRSEEEKGISEFLKRDKRFRLYGTPKEFVEQIKIFSNFPGAHKFFMTKSTSCYYTRPVTHLSLKDEKFLHKTDLFVTLQTMMLYANPSSREVIVRSMMAVYLKSVEDTLSGSIEFLRMKDEDNFENEIESTKVTYVDCQNRLQSEFLSKEILEKIKSDFSKFSIAEIVEKFKKLVTIQWREAESKLIYSMVEDAQTQLGGNKFLLYIVCCYTNSCFVIKAFQNVIKKREECFMMRGDTKSEKCPITVRLFEDGHRQFAMKSELLRALNITKKSTRKSSKCEKLIACCGLESIDAIELEEIQKKYKDKLSDIEFIRYPILRTKHRAIPIKMAESQEFFIYGVDAMIELLRSLVWGARIFQKYDARHKKELYALFGDLGAAFRADFTQPTFIQLQRLQDIARTCELRCKCNKKTTLKDVREVKSNGFSLNDLTDELKYLDLLEAFPEILGHAEVVFQAVDRVKKEKVLRTCDMYDAVEYCQMICVFEKFPKLHHFLHHQKSCRRIPGLPCSTCPPFPFAPPTPATESFIKMHDKTIVYEQTPLGRVLLTEVDELPDKMKKRITGVCVGSTVTRDTVDKPKEATVAQDTVAKPKVVTVTPKDTVPTPEEATVPQCIKNVIDDLTATVTQMTEYLVDLQEATVTLDTVVKLKEDTVTQKPMDTVAKPTGHAATVTQNTVSTPKVEKTTVTPDTVAKPKEATVTQKIQDDKPKVTVPFPFPPKIPTVTQASKNTVPPLKPTVSQKPTIAAPSIQDNKPKATVPTVTQTTTKPTVTQEVMVTVVDVEGQELANALKKELGKSVAAGSKIVRSGIIVNGKYGKPFKSPTVLLKSDLKKIQNLAKSFPMEQRIHVVAPDGLRPHIDVLGQGDDLTIKIGMPTVESEEKSTQVDYCSQTDGGGAEVQKLRKKLVGFEKKLTDLKAENERNVEKWRKDLKKKQDENEEMRRKISTDDMVTRTNQRLIRELKDKNIELAELRQELSTQIVTSKENNERIELMEPQLIQYQEENERITVEIGRITVENQEIRQTDVRIKEAYSKIRTTYEEERIKFSERISQMGLMLRCEKQKTAGLKSQIENMGSTRQEANNKDDYIKKLEDCNALLRRQNAENNELIRDLLKKLKNKPSTLGQNSLPTTSTSSRAPLLTTKPRPLPIGSGRARPYLEPEQPPPSPVPPIQLPEIRMPDSTWIPPDIQMATCSSTVIQEATVTRPTVPQEDTVPPGLDVPPGLTTVTRSSIPRAMAPPPGITVRQATTVTRPSIPRATAPPPGVTVRQVTVTSPTATVSQWSQPAHLSTVCEEELHDSQCVICLMDMETEQEGLIKCHECRRRFHGECASEWLRVKSICPICKGSLLDPHEFPSL